VTTKEVAKALKDVATDNLRETYVELVMDMYADDFRGLFEAMRDAIDGSAPIKPVSKRRSKIIASIHEWLGLEAEDEEGMFEALNMHGFILADDEK
jgi:hypothetical protein